MIPQLWPRTGPLDKLNEAQGRRRRGGAYTTPGSPRVAGIVGTMVILLVALLIIIGIVLTFVRH